MAHPGREQAVEVRSDSRVLRPVDVRAMEMAHTFHSILSEAKKSPAAYVRLWDIPGGAE